MLGRVSISACGSAASQTMATGAAPRFEEQVRVGMPGAGYSRRTEDAPVHSPSREASLQDDGAEAIRAIKAPFLSASATVFVEEAALHYKRREKSPRKQVDLFGFQRTPLSSR